MDREAIVRDYVLQELEGSRRSVLYSDAAGLLEAEGHLRRVAEAARFLAGCRGVDQTLAAMAGWLHDFYADMTGDRPGHAHKGAVLAKEVLEILKVTTQEETDQVVAAVDHHSEKFLVHAPLDEVLKDADVVAHRQEDAIAPEDEDDLWRWDRLVGEASSFKDQSLKAFLEAASAGQP